MSLRDSVSSAWEAVPTTITSGGSQSSSVNLGGLRLFGVVMPTAWTPASLSFQVSYDDGASWLPLKNMYDGSEISAVVNAYGYFPLPDPRVFSCIPLLKLQSGSSSNPVSQEADRALTLILGGI